ncbi:hypothetical protein BJY52DRAFT_1272978 [Lactarius psammicola]|nr:hypothetical protein BJY52DRAFT_1272978 [Lactarius psammicola]
MTTCLCPCLCWLLYSHMDLLCSNCVVLNFTQPYRFVCERVNQGARLVIHGASEVFCYTSKRSLCSGMRSLRSRRLDTHKPPLANLIFL